MSLPNVPKIILQCSTGREKRENNEQS
uniref:Uncharacterized protein n=1 Tax=Arundo donax TaxID=35708 RepID=A0A0A9BM57_ARUDO